MLELSIVFSLHIGFCFTKFESSERLTIRRRFVQRQEIEFSHRLVGHMMCFEECCSCFIFMKQINNFLIILNILSAQVEKAKFFIFMWLFYLMFILFIQQFIHGLLFIGHIILL